MGWSVSGGACYPTAPEAVGAFMPSLPQRTVLADGSIVTANPDPLIYGLEACEPGSMFCALPGFQVSYTKAVYDPPNATGLDGYVYSDAPVYAGRLAPCEYKGSAEYWGPVLAAFFLAGVVILCGRSIAGIFRRETY